MKKQNKIDKKRRRKGMTNYHKRLTLLKSGINRIVVRKTNKYIIFQVIESRNAQDKVLCTISTKELLELGWPEEKKGSLKSLTASYLGGLLIGKKAINKGVERVILDSGMIPNTKGSRVYAAVKGIADSGVKIPFKEEVLPEKIEKYSFFNKVKERIEKDEKKK